MPNLNTLIPYNTTRSTLAHTLSMRTLVPDANGTLQDLFVVLGRVQSFAPNQTRAVEKIWEINTANGGEAVEIVPGSITDDTIAITRIDVYPLPYLLAFGATESNNIRSQNIPFTIIEYIFDPKDVRKSIQIEYVNCYLSDFSDPLEIGTPMISVSGSVSTAFRTSKPIFGSSAFGSVSGSNVVNTTLKSLDWLSFKKDPTSGQQTIPIERLNNKTGSSDFTLLDQNTLSSLANVCIELEG